jgi:2-polyprenyl-3-methyl-5-hydroxy-6-metoxy-1,4-benzoquinol methylase
MDHMISKEYFFLVQCSDCLFIYTNPRPAPSQLERYYQSSNYISHAEAGKKIVDSIYFLARNYMLRKKLSWIRNYCSIDTPLLDYGCGTGALIQFLLKRGWNAWGIEPNLLARSIAHKNSPDHIYSTISELPSQSFGIITLWHVLEHLSHLEHDLNEILSLLSSSGYLFIAVPNCNSFDAKYYGSVWAGYDVPRHLSHFTPETMKVLARKLGLELIKVYPLKLDAYYVSILSEKYRKGSFVRALVQGYISNKFARKHQSNYSSLVYVLKK